MTFDIQLRLSPADAANDATIRQQIAKKQHLSAGQITAIQLLKRSIDARQRNVLVQLTYRVYVGEQPSEQRFPPIHYPDVHHKPSAIVVGAGPGGLFAALRLIELGVRPIVLERGKDVHARKRDIASISRDHLVDPESNYSFGEGGAGAFSDGKLYTRSKKRGNVDKILQVFCQHGADPAIRIDAHPHIGTDLLPRVIEKMRNTILERGGEVHFNTRMAEILLEKGTAKGVITNNGEEFIGPVILATGHSARDVYRWLHAHNVTLEAKGIAVGVRLEHPSELIDQLQYHHPDGRGNYLPAAEYNYVTQVEERGVYSFCMCPGGFVVPAASAPEQVVVNGMSASRRNSPWSNSGMVVEIRPEDVTRADLQVGEAPYPTDALALLHFQEALEQQAWLNGGRRQTAPAQCMYDFTKRKLSNSLPDSSYAPGLVASPLHFWLPPFISTRLTKGFEHFGRCSRGFLTNEAVMIGVETRTSSPVRILRQRDTLEHVTVSHLYPCGEGAGYAGGIVSAAIDGERCAESLATQLNTTSSSI